MNDARTIIFPAKRIITMNASQPEATAVAVRGGRILGVGRPEDLAGWGRHEVDDSFAGKVLIPGLVEAHSHVTEAGSWSFTWAGPYDRRAPDGKVHGACRSVDEVLARLTLAERELEGDGPFIAWGFDPLSLADGDLDRRHLDRVSASRVVVVAHASLHKLSVNSAGLTAAGITRDTAIEGVERLPDVEPSGVLAETRAMLMAGRPLLAVVAAWSSEAAIRDFGRLARNVGCTTISDLGTTNMADEAAFDRWSRVVNAPEFPARVDVSYGSVPNFPLPSAGRDAAARKFVEMRTRSTDKLFVGRVKLVADGSIQGFSARLRWPGYFNGAGNGIWNIEPADLRDLTLAFHKAGLQVNCHCNGDEAIDAFIDAVAYAQAQAPRFDHRHTIQHAQMITDDQLKRAKALGMCVNLFANHLWYWGDVHHEITLGPERAARLDPCGAALRHGVPMTIHSDAGVTPLGQLHTAWCAVNRTTQTGRVLGEAERISAGEALYAATMGAAYQLFKDREIGSIEAGKFADFAVLEEDPLAVAPMELKDVPVWGTVLGGKPCPAER